MNLSKLIASLLLGCFVVASTQAAVDSSKLSKKKQTSLGLYLDAKQAYDHMLVKGDKTLFIDVRSRPEVNFLGMPTVADANVPYMEMNEWYAWDAKKNNFKMEVNSEFIPSLEQRLESKDLSKNDTIILICRSGSRSSKAADLLAKQGYTNVYTVIDGYEGGKVKSGKLKGQRLKNGWKNANLPWTYSLDKNKMYTVSN